MIYLLDLNAISDYLAGLPETVSQVDTCNAAGKTWGYTIRMIQQSTLEVCGYIQMISLTNFCKALDNTRAPYILNNMHNTMRLGIRVAENVHQALASLDADSWHTRTAIAAAMKKKRLNISEIAALDMLLKADLIKVRLQDTPNSTVVQRWEYQIVESKDLIDKRSIGQRAIPGIDKGG